MSSTVDGPFLYPRSCAGLSIPNGSRAFPPGVSGAAGQVRFGVTCGKDTADRVRAVRRSRSETARRGKTRNLHLPRFHPLLWAAQDQWSIHRLADHGEEANGGEA